MILFRIIELLMCTNKKKNKQPTKQILFDIIEIISHPPQTFQAPSQGLGERPATPIVTFMFLTRLTVIHAKRDPFPTVKFS